MCSRRLLLLFLGSLALFLIIAVSTGHHLLADILEHAVDQLLLSCRVLGLLVVQQVCVGVKFFDTGLNIECVRVIQKCTRVHLVHHSALQLSKGQLVFLVPIKLFLVVRAGQ